MNFQELKAKWERLQDAHSKQFSTPRGGEGDYNESVHQLKRVYYELAEAAEREGVDFPIVMWP